MTTNFGCHGKIIVGQRLLMVVNLGEPVRKLGKLAALLCTHDKNAGRNVCDRVC